MQSKADEFLLGGCAFQSRLLIGTARFPDLETLRASIAASGSQIATVALRRIDFKEKGEGSLLHLLEGMQLLPNTAGCFTARDAVLTAQLAREALGTNWIKVEVFGDERTEYPDHEELLKACKELVRDGFVVLPYCGDDLVVCKKLQDVGCAAVMPFGSLIGAGRGIANPHHLELIREMLQIPMIVDAGIGTASDAAQALELGADAVLVNSAIARAKHPVLMAQAMKHGVEAGRFAFLAGRIPKSHYAVASSPKIGRIQCSKF